MKLMLSVKCDLGESGAIHLFYVKVFSIIDALQLRLLLY